MAYGANKRKCRRFEIPGAEGKYKKSGLLVSIKGFSEPCPVLNVSKGGLAFVCNKELLEGDKIMVQLQAPNEISLDLRSIVTNQREWTDMVSKVIGVQFMPFGDRRSSNPRESLDVLRKLDAQYGTDEY